MAAARDALPGAIAAASADASGRAAAAVAALTAPSKALATDEGPSTVRRSTLDAPESPGSSSGSSRRSSPSTVLPRFESSGVVPETTPFDRASAHSLAAARAAADAATAAAADRVRRTLPFELHARIQSEARAALRTALAAVKAEARVRAADGSTADGSTAAPTPTDGTAHVGETTRDDGRRLFETCASLRAAAETGATAAELAGKTRETAAEIRATLARDGYDDDVSADGYETSPCVDAARALARLLFAFPPRDAPRGEGDDGSYRVRSRLASRDDACAAASAAVAAAWRVSIDDDGSSSDDEASPLASAIASAFLDPDAWLPRIAGAAAGSPFAQRRAEFAAVATLTSIPSTRWRRAVRAVPRARRRRDRDGFGRRVRGRRAVAQSRRGCGGGVRRGREEGRGCRGGGGCEGVWRGPRGPMRRRGGETDASQGGARAARNVAPALRVVRSPVSLLLRYYRRTGAVLLMRSGFAARLLALLCC